jgi:hypothetical protein
MSDWTDWYDGLLPFDMLGDVQVTTARVGKNTVNKHRWARYKHEATILDLLAGKLRLIPSRAGPERPKEKEG